mgnify:CR=1 FL=1
MAQELTKVFTFPEIIDEQIKAKFLTIPKYIEANHQKQERAEWVGSSITAKVFFFFFF